MTAADDAPSRSSHDRASLEESVVGRIAPSPTGHLHLGHASSFLVAWWSVRSRGGTIRLLMDDVDVARAEAKYVASIMEDLRWLGLDWDGAPVFSSHYTASIAEATSTLLDEKRAFPCVCTRGDIRRANEALAGGSAYPGTCRGRYDSIESARSAAGNEPGIRFRVDVEEVSFDDQLFGTQRYHLARDSGDFLIRRRDGLPAYQLAIVAVDRALGTTEVVRGRDLLESTARQVLLLEALGLRRPDYLHLPLVCDHEGRRLSKTEASCSLLELRSGGVRAEDVISWVARQHGLPLPSPATKARDVLAFFRKQALAHEDIRLPTNPTRLLRGT